MPILLLRIAVRKKVFLLMEDGFEISGAEIL
jgi:hypothetical protein